MFPFSPRRIPRSGHSSLTPRHKPSVSVPPADKNVHLGPDRPLKKHLLLFLFSLKDGLFGNKMFCWKWGECFNIKLQYAHRKTTTLGNVCLMHHLPRNYPSFKFTCSLQFLSEDNLFDELKCYEDSQVHNIVHCYYNSHSCGPLPHNNSG